MLEQLLLAMKKKGLKMTPQRRLIASCIAKQTGFFSIDKLYDRVKEEQKDISMDTVYRNVNALCDIGMLYKIDKLGRGFEYELTAGRHLHYMVCQACGARQAFTDCLFDKISLQCRETSGFLCTGHKFELYGFCRDCQKESCDE